MIPPNLRENLRSVLAYQDDDNIVITILLEVEQWLQERHFGLAAQDVRMAITNIARSRQWRGARRN